MNQLVDNPPVIEEDQARADWYALLARLWYAAPDAQLLQQLANADEAWSDGAGTPLAEAWAQLRKAAAVMEPLAVRLEYDSVFVGTGKAEVTPYMAHYFPGTTGKEKILLRVRDQLDELGLARTADKHEPEDHLAALCDVMRHLIQREPVTRQEAFFRAFLRPCWRKFLERAEASAQTHFYKRVARFNAAFFAIEEQAFDMM
ncbi:MAG TPA: molecular chaperone TorD family protein [Burkholderiales bacterium]|nr:molecular chaperone TorD family protein [Burkholderiales bacterium]